MFNSCTNPPQALHIAAEQQLLLGFAVRRRLSAAPPETELSERSYEMGRGRHRGRSQRKHFKESRDNVWKRPKSDPPIDSDNPVPVPENPSSWAPLVTENPAFEEYYKEQGIVKPEEWDLFMEILRKPLPAAFRVSYSQFCDDILSKLENDFMKSLQAEAIEGGESEAIKPLPWYPKNLAWHSNFSRKQIRKVQTLQRFHEFLKLENEVGNITRQEAVSMVPPLFLDVHPDHFVLDMCAAPGSKTFQLLEIIHGSSEPGSLPNGMVVANDVDFQRSNLLIHQTKRMCTANLIVTNHEGQQFPGCRLNKSLSRVSEKGLGGDSHINQLAFDRILCDVPCSGDGTLRKAPDIWRKWNTGMGNGLHGLQVLLAMRGLSLLKVGGRMIYSTCSMNPVEDEAVVAEILRRCGGSVELLDVSNELPELIRRPGLKKWKVRDRGVWFTSYKDVPKYRRGGVLQSMFPSGKSYKDTTENMEKDENGGADSCQDGCKETETPEAAASESVEEVSDLPLERCMRILPHDQNTGAFFIAVLHKISPLPEPQEKPNPRRNSSIIKSESSEKSLDEATEVSDTMAAEPKEGAEEKDSEAASSNEVLDSKADEDDGLEPEKKSADGESIVEQTQEPDDKGTNSANTGGKRKVPMQGKWIGFDPVVFLKDETVINSIKTFYGISESFPLQGHLVTRNSDTSSMKRIYYVSRSVKDVLELNFAVGQQLKIASVGLKMFERQSSREGTSAPCSFRISSEGLPMILPYITKQILYAPMADFKHLLQYKSIKFPDFVDQKLGQKAADLAMGCCVVILNGGTQPAPELVKVDASTIAIGCWRGKVSLGVMVTTTDCQELLERLNDRTMSVEDSSVNGSNGKASGPQDMETA